MNEFINSLINITLRRSFDHVRVSLRLLAANSRPAAQMGYTAL